jgi:hypothetical protein|tara:strand:+ start:195 stop:1514 length:1320 start_codon:yes stop_codon:yes gene_type:complete
MRFTTLINEITELITEASRYEVLVDKFAKPKKKASGKVVKPKIPLETLKVLMLADPTTKQDTASEEATGDVQKVGAYSQWLIKQWMGLQQKADAEYAYGSPDWGVALERHQDLFLEDLYKVTEDLQKFNRFKSRIPEDKRDINRISNTDELYEITKDFSLENVDLTKSEEKERRKREDVDYLYDGNRFEVVVPKTKDVSCDMAGAPLTRWCTASSSYSYFERYSPQGPLYIIRDKNDIVKEGRGVGEPRPIYQFHFPSNQFMDAEDRSINLESFLQGDGVELKEFFKHEFSKSLNKEYGDKVQINYPNDNVSRFIALYGFEEFLEKLPPTLKRFDFEKGSRYGSEKGDTPKVSLPNQIFNFPNLEVLHVEGILESLPQDIERLQNLQFISIPNNPNLKELPASISKLPKLDVLNLRGTPATIPDEIKQLEEEGKIVIVQ